MNEGFSGWNPRQIIVGQANKLGCKTANIDWMCAQALSLNPKQYL